MPSLVLEQPSSLLKLRNVLERVLPLSRDEAKTLLKAHNRAEIEALLAKHEVPDDAEAVRFFLDREKYVVSIRKDVGCLMVREIHPEAYEF